MNSDYASTTNQAGIYAGKKDFDVTVKGNTDLKGAVIDSTASEDKNKLTTGTLSFSDIKNSAEYSTSGGGFSYDITATKNSNAMLGDKINIEPYIGIDYGRVWGSMDEYQLGNSLAGAVIGVKGKMAKEISYDVFLGMPLYYPKGFKADKKVLGFSMYWQI